MSCWAFEPTCCGRRRSALEIAAQQPLRRVHHVLLVIAVELIREIVDLARRLRRGLADQVAPGAGGLGEGGIGRALLRQDLVVRLLRAGATDRRPARPRSRASASGCSESIGAVDRFWDALLNQSGICVLELDCCWLVVVCEPPLLLPMTFPFQGQRLPKVQRRRRAPAGLPQRPKPSPPPHGGRDGAALLDRPGVHVVLQRQAVAQVTLRQASNGPPCGAGSRAVR